MCINEFLKKAKIFLIIIFVFLLTNYTLASQAMPRYAINEKTKECSEFFMGDECMYCNPPTGWDLIEEFECPIGYEEVEENSVCEPSKTEFCCTVSHSGGNGDCDDVVVNEVDQKCAFVDDIATCDGLPDDWSQVEDLEFWGKLCPSLDYEWVEDLDCEDENIVIPIQDYGCGEFNGDIAGLFDESLDPENNSTLVCLGRSLLNDCEVNNALINNELIEVKGGSREECSIGNAQINSVHNINDYIKEMEASPDYSLPELHPGALAATLLFITALQNIDIDDSWKNLPPDNRPTFDEIFMQDFIDEITEITGYNDINKIEDCDINYGLSDECRYSFEKDGIDSIWVSLDLERVNHETLSINNNSNGLDASYSYVDDCPSEAYFDIEKAKIRAKDDYNNLIEINSKVFKQKEEVETLNNWSYYTLLSSSFGSYKFIAIKDSWVLDFDFPDKMIDGEFDKWIEIIDILGDRINSVKEGPKNTEYPVTYNFEPVLLKESELTDKLKGKIILKVEENGEAYYINPINSMMYFLSRPEDAFNVMREQGVGVTNADLEKIAIGLGNITGIDSDNDGLSDIFENAINTNINKSDTDGDGFGDKQELEGDYDPNKAGGVKLGINNNFAEKQKGKIFLQVEQNGEAWYINPADGKRYFLGRPADAFQVMRNLGLGISNDDFGKLVDGDDNQNNKIMSENICIEESGEWKIVEQLGTPYKLYGVCICFGDKNINEGVSDSCIEEDNTVGEICELNTKEECEYDNECYWKNQGGKITAHYNCCPKDTAKNPMRCLIMVD